MEELQTDQDPDQQEDDAATLGDVTEKENSGQSSDDAAPSASPASSIPADPPSHAEPSFPSERLKRAAHMLFFKRGRVPGAKAWELKAGLGKSYQKVLDQLDEELKELDLQVKKVEAGGIDDYSPEDEADKFRYFVRLRGTLTPKEARMSGWRIDNLAALAAALALVVSKQGKVERKELESLISEKAGRWRTLTLTDTFLRTGYLEEDEDGTISLGWRTKAEIDLPSLMMLVAEAKPADIDQGDEKLDASYVDGDAS
ncbi:MAG TPA: hypothetical protein VE177_06720, partial [Candidatus Binatus sp.]|nr:hypothetical protein [Candidatus Binatus sp.]